MHGVVVAVPASVTGAPVHEGARGRGGAGG